MDLAENVRLSPIKWPVTVKGAYRVYDRGTGKLLGTVSRVENKWVARTLRYEWGRQTNRLRNLRGNFDTRRDAVWEVWTERETL